MVQTQQKFLSTAQTYKLYHLANDNSNTSWALLMSTLYMLTHLTFTRTLWGNITINFLWEWTLRQKEIKQLGQVHIVSICITGTWIQATWLVSPYFQLWCSAVGIHRCDSDLDPYLLFMDEGIVYLRGKVISSKFQNELATEVIFLLMNTNKYSGNNHWWEFWFIIIVIQLAKRLNKCEWDSTHYFYLTMISNGHPSCSQL